MLLDRASARCFCATGGCKQSAWTLWDAYSARFIDAQGRVFDPKGDQHTTSEGQAYALFFALADNDRAHFDRVLTWTQVNLAAGDLNPSAAGSGARTRTASGRRSMPTPPPTPTSGWPTRWSRPAGFGTIPSTRNLGREMMAQIAKHEVANLPGFGPMLMPGPDGFQHDTDLDAESQLSAGVCLSSGSAQIDPPARGSRSPRNIPTPAGAERAARLCHGLGGVCARRRLLSGGRAAARAEQGDATAPGGSYDAIRVYLWAGMLDRRRPSADADLNAVPAMALSCQS